MSHNRSTLSREKLVLYGRAVLVNGLAFIICYLAANDYAARAALRYEFYFSWEQQIPFIPAWIIVYLSIFLWFWTPLFALEQAAITRFSRAFLLTTLIASVMFFLFPAEPLFDRSLHHVEHSVVYRLVYWMDKPHNLFPSLHIAYITLFLAVFSREKSPCLLLYYIWAALMMVSVLLTHQHGVVDIVGGIGLGLLVFFSYYDLARRRRRA